VRAVIFSSPCLDARQWERDQRELLAQMPAEVRATVERCEQAGSTDSPEYEEAKLAYYHRHVCRLDPWPDAFERSYAGVNQTIYEYMAGPSEFAIVGTLREWDVGDRLGEIEVPTLITCGEHDELSPAYAKEIQARIARAELEVFPDASHVTMAEVPEAYRTRLNEFFDRVEAASLTSRT
jgi:proline iminopeptidase